MFPDQVSPTGGGTDEAPGEEEGDGGTEEAPGEEEGGGGGGIIGVAAGGAGAGVALMVGVALWCVWRRRKRHQPLNPYPHTASHDAYTAIAPRTEGSVCRMLRVEG